LYYKICIKSGKKYKGKKRITYAGRHIDSRHTALHTQYNKLIFRKKDRYINRQTWADRQLVVSWKQAY
jgi:hypothetical protein